MNTHTLISTFTLHTRKNIFSVASFLIILLLTHFISLEGCAQQLNNKNPVNSYRAVHWTIHDGLSDGMTNCMMKDVNGFLWIGTANGLNRFDGSLFKKYYHDSHNAHSISGNFIMNMIEDSLHNIWIGTDRGCTRYDIMADTFTNFASAGTKYFGIDVIPFSATKNQVYAIRGSSKIVSYNIHDFSQKELADLSPADSAGDGMSLFHSIYDPKENNIWLLRGIRQFAGGGLMKISLKDGSKKYYSWQCFRHIPGHGHSAEGMRLDRSRNAIWINTSDGLIEFTLLDEQFHHIDALNKWTSLKNYERWVSIDLDTLNRVWLATIPAGILIYDPVKNTVSQPFQKDSLVQSAVSDYNSTLYCDRDGLIWSGFWWPLGIYQIIPFSPTVQLFRPDPRDDLPLNHNAVWNFNWAAPGKLWIQAYHGITLFDNQTDQLDTTAYRSLRDPQGAAFRPPELIDSLLEKALVTHFNNGSLQALDMKSKTLSPIILKDSLNQPIKNYDFHVLQRFKNTMVVTAAYDNSEGIFVFDLSDNSAKEVMRIRNNSYWIFSTTDGESYFFVKYEVTKGNQTYRCLNGHWMQVPNPTDSIDWTSILYDRKHHWYWVAAEKKLIQYDTAFTVRHIYSKSDGLPENLITGLIDDNQGNIWFHTDRSIHQLNIRTGRISTLSEKDGFEKQYFESLQFKYKDEYGDIYFPGGNFGSGFDRIRPINYTNPPSTIYLQSLLINQQPLGLTTGLNATQELDLRYNQNTVAIETGILDYYSKGSSQIRYKLESEGKESNWLYGPAGYTIRFEDMEPGLYTLRMQASTAALQFNGPEKVLSISISQPWWQTWWARFLYVVLFLFLLWRFIQYRSNNLKQRNIELEEKVIGRTKDLKLSLEELKSTQNQLIQREKMASLGELTAGIAHEIQNPLNFVNNFSEINAELIDEMNEELRSGNLEEATKVSGIVRENNVKISHHGQRADSIVKGMLQHSRSNSGEKEAININGLAEEYMRLSYHGLRAKDKTFNATLVTDFDPKTVNINAAAQDLGRVFLNLFNNSFYAVNEKNKISEKGYEPTVWLSTLQKNNQMEIRIKDNGMGIPQKIREKIFQPFFTTKPTGEGTGLGLSLSYDIITKGHGGELKMESKEGEYTEFIIELPVKAVGG